MTFSKNIYENQEFLNIQAINQDISYKEFNNCVFKKCNFSQSDFQETTFSDCKFLSCNLSNILLKETWLHNVRFEKSKLVWVNFSLLNIFYLWVGFYECMINICNFTKLNLSKTKFINSTIYDCDFINTNLTKSDFFDSNLKQSKFIDCNLIEANFENASSYFIDPTRNKLKKARFSQPDVLNLLSWFEIEII